MPDTEISRLTELPAVLVDEKDVLAIVDDSASETKKVKAVALAQAAVDALADGTLDPDKINWNGLDPGVIDGAAIKDRSLDGVKLKLNTITRAEIAPNAIESSELANNAVDTTAIQNNAVTGDKIDNAALEARHYGTGSINSGALAENSVGSSELANGAVDTAALQDNAVTADKLAPNLDGDDILATGSVNSAIANGAITESKLADDAVTTNKIATNAVTDTKISGVSGSKLTNSSVPVGKLEAAGFSHGIELDGTVKHTNSVSAGTRNGISFDAQGHVTGTSALQSTDLPIATENTVGGISVPASSGLTVNNNGAIDHADTIAPGTAAKVTFNSHGHITGTEFLAGSDLPAATATTRGGVTVPTTNSNPVRVDGNGNLTHDTSPLAAGTYVSLTVDDHGHAVNGDAVLQVGQVPGLSADKITSGQFGTNRIEDHSLTAAKLTDYSTCLMQEDHPGSSPDYYLGLLWYQPSTAQLRVYARGSGPMNIWRPVGFGLLQQQNLRFAFTFDASTSTITSITQYGAPLGIAVGDPIPTATDTLSGAYGVCVAEGNGITLHDVNGDNFTVGDWILCGGETTGWIHIDIADGSGGGGGGAQRLDDLLDVTIGGVNPVDVNLDPNIQPRVALQDGDILRYYSSIGQWVNAPERAGVEMGTTPPASAPPGTMWWDTDSGRLFISYDDGNTVQWVPATPEAGGGSSGGGGGGGTADSLNGLNDVQAAKTANAVLFYNDINSRWESTTTIESAAFTIDGGSF